MNTLFYIAGGVAVVATALVITRSQVIHALLYLVISLFAVAVAFYTLGAPFIAALEVIVYAGAIMVLFLFVVMLLNLGKESAAQERALVAPRAWVGPALLALILVAELAYILSQQTALVSPKANVEPKQVGMALYGTYLLGVELASMLLLAGLIGARHLGQPVEEQQPAGGKP